MKNQPEKDFDEMSQEERIDAIFQHLKAKCAEHKAYVARIVREAGGRQGTGTRHGDGEGGEGLND